MIARCNALKYFEYSGTKVFMNGPFVCKLCVGEETDPMKMNFKSFFHFQQLFALPVSTSAKDFRHTGSLLGLLLAETTKEAKKLLIAVLAEI